MTEHTSEPKPLTTDDAGRQRDTFPGAALRAQRARELFEEEESSPPTATASASRPTPEDIRAAAQRLGLRSDEYGAHIMVLSPEQAADEVARALAPNEPLADDPDIVYGVFDYAENLVFIPDTRARDLAEVVDAWWHSSTWGELRERLEQKDLATEFLARFGYPDNYPADDEPLTDREKEDNTTDGDWPGWPDAEQLHWMPQDVIDMGYSGISMVSGPCVGFEPVQEEDVVAALGRHGLTCRRDDALVRAAYALSF